MVSGYNSHNPVKCKAARRMVRGLLAPSSRSFSINYKEKRKLFKDVKWGYKNNKTDTTSLKSCFSIKKENDCQPWISVFPCHLSSPRVKMSVFGVSGCFRTHLYQTALVCTDRTNQCAINSGWGAMPYLMGNTFWYVLSSVQPFIGLFCRCFTNWSGYKQKFNIKRNRSSRYWHQVLQYCWEAHKDSI